MRIKMVYQKISNIKEGSDQGTEEQKGTRHTDNKY